MNDFARDSMKEVWTKLLRKTCRSKSADCEERSGKGITKNY